MPYKSITWYENRLDILYSQGQCYILLRGILFDNIIQIIADLYLNDKYFSIIEFNKPIKLYLLTEIINEDIRNKYIDKINKIKMKYNKMKLPELLMYFHNKLSDKKLRKELIHEMQKL